MVFIASTMKFKTNFIQWIHHWKCMYGSVSFVMWTSKTIPFFGNVCQRLLSLRVEVRQIPVDLVGGVYESLAQHSTNVVIVSDLRRDWKDTKSGHRHHRMFQGEGRLRKPNMVIAAPTNHAINVIEHKLLQRISVWEAFYVLLKTSWYGKWKRNGQPSTRIHYPIAPTQLPGQSYWTSFTLRHPGYIRFTLSCASATQNRKDGLSTDISIMFS